MLSILIPTYNYSVFPLVLELKNQADLLAIPYEIIVLDDASTLFLDENSKIQELENCYYTLNKENLGRGNTINSLNSKANFENVLIMEADAFPKSKNYLQKIIASISPSTTVVFGGVNYAKQKPKSNSILRWKYGKTRETISLEKRLKNPYNFVFTWNLLLKKEFLSQNNFPTNIREYGYEDAAFIKKLKEKSVFIQHIENELIHHNQETSLIFIEKTEKAVSTLQLLIQSKELDYEDTSLGIAYKIIKKMRLNSFILFLFQKFNYKLKLNLTSKNPNLYLFDFYKLGYFCTLKKNKNV